MEIKTVKMDIPDGCNIIIGHAHFIKTAEDLYEVMVNSIPQARFGLACSEASDPCLIRAEGNEDKLKEVATNNAMTIGAGHAFVILMKDAYPINVLNAIKQCPEVCTVYCATANPVEVIVAEMNSGRAVIGVIDGMSPKGVEGKENVSRRREFLRKVGYKL
jgi:adenosine/AMP kinase